MQRNCLRLRSAKYCLLSAAIIVNYELLSREESMYRSHLYMSVHLNVTVASLRFIFSVRQCP